MTGPLLKIASVVVCAVPARYRTKWPLYSDDDLRGPAIASGLIEFFLGAPGTMMYVGMAISVAKGGFGVAGLVLNPFTPSVFLMAEGGVRFLAALAAYQVLPTLPLAIIAWIHGSKEDKEHELHLGARVPDKIERGEGKPWDLRVLSCRAKPHWNSYNTIHFDGEFYQLCGQDLTTGNRKFVYLLRRHPPTRLVVVVYEYDPSDVLDPNAPPRRWKPT